jgi:transposase
MEDHPAAVIDKAKRLEQLLQRVAQGEFLEQVCAELDLVVDAKGLARLQAKYEASGCTWEALLDGRYGHPKKAHSALREWLYERKRQDKALTAPELVDELKVQFQVGLSAGHVNYLLRKVELTRPPGRVPSRPAAEDDPAGSETSSPSLDKAGIFFPGSSPTRDGRYGGRGDLSGDGSPAASGRQPHDPSAGGGERT